LLSERCKLSALREHKPVWPDIVAKAAALLRVVETDTYQLIRAKLCAFILCLTR